MSGHSIVERTNVVLSKKFNGLSLKNSKHNSYKNNANSVSDVMEKLNAASNEDSNAMSPKISDKNLVLGGKICTKTHNTGANDLLMDDNFLSKIFTYFSSLERANLARVCTRWRDHLYKSPSYWNGLMLCVHCKYLKNCSTNEKCKFYASFVRRGFHCLCLIAAKDDDIMDIINVFPFASKQVHSLIFRWCPISDKGMEMIIDHMQALQELELIGCNEVTESGLWACLTPRIVTLKLADCINIADEAVGAVAQLLPSLYEFSLQAYHVTDAALSFFTTKQGASLNVLKLNSCWEITNHGIVNIVHSLPNLTILSLSGCTKISDDGVELISENLRNLRCLDLSWCPRVSDAALEYIACDLIALERLCLDRCVNITDIGVGYLSTMPCLQALFLRWCSQIRDYGIHHLCTMRSLRVLSLAGCPLLTAGGLSSLSQMKQLQELELTNCPGTSPQLLRYLKEQLPNCNIVE